MLGTFRRKTVESRARHFVESVQTHAKMPRAFSVKLGACTCELILDDQATIGNLHDAVRAAFDVPEDASLRLLTKGKSLPADLACLLYTSPSPRDS